MFMLTVILWNYINQKHLKSFVVVGTPLNGINLYVMIICVCDVIRERTAVLWEYNIITGEQTKTQLK